MENRWERASKLRTSAGMTCSCFPGEGSQRRRGKPPGLQLGQPHVARDAFLDSGQLSPDRSAECSRVRHVISPPQRSPPYPLSVIDKPGSGPFSCPRNVTFVTFVPPESVVIHWGVAIAGNSTQNPPNHTAEVAAGAGSVNHDLRSTLIPAPPRRVMTAR